MGVVLFLCWLAAAGQVLAVISERYGPYPAPRRAPGPRADRAVSSPPREATVATK